MSVRRQYAIVIVALVVAEIAIVWPMTSATAALEWMNVYRLGDSVDGWRFISELRIPVPPHLALFEIWNYDLTGTTWFATTLLYKLYIVVAYACAVALAYPSIRRAIITGTLGLLFTYATSLIHSGNPQIYDVAAPCFFLLFAVLLRLGTERTGATALAGAAVCLAFFDLSRPFVVYLLPFIVVAALVRMRRFGRPMLPFLVPFLLISGTWHVHLLTAFGQLTSSNHAGINLWRCWNSRVPPLEHPIPEDDAPLGPGHRAFLNNPQHIRNSRKLQGRVLRYVRTHPADSLAFVARRIWIFTAGESRIYGHAPQSVLLLPYSLAVRVASLWFIASAAFWSG